MSAVQESSALWSRINWLPVGPGFLTLRPKPGNKWLANGDAKRLGVTHVVTLMGEVGLTSDVEKNCARGGLIWLNIPLKTAHIPGQEVADIAYRVIRDIGSALRDGAHVLLHCAAGLHRTGMIANALLRYEGYDADTALRMIRRARKLTAECVGAKRLAWAEVFLAKYGTHPTPLALSHPYVPTAAAESPGEPASAVDAAAAVEEEEKEKGRVGEGRGRGKPAVAAAAAAMGRSHGPGRTSGATVSAATVAVPAARKAPTSRTAAGVATARTTLSVRVGAVAR